MAPKPQLIKPIRPIQLHGEGSEPAPISPPSDGITPLRGFFGPLFERVKGTFISERLRRLLGELVSGSRVLGESHGSEETPSSM